MTPEEERAAFITAHDSFGLTMKDQAKELGGKGCAIVAQEIDDRSVASESRLDRIILAFATYGLTKTLASLAEGGEDISDY